MKDEKKRTLYLKVRVSPEEMAAIKKKFENSGMSSLSTFVRAMIFEWYIAQVNENELKELTRIANNVANNINQIAHRANVTNKIYKEDIEEVKSLASQIIDPLLFLQTKVLQLKHWQKSAVRRNPDSTESRICALCTGSAFEIAARFTRMVTIIPQSWTLEELSAIMDSQ